MRLAPRLLGAAVLLGCAASAAAHVGHGVPRAGRSSAAGVPLDLYERHAAGSAVRHAKVARRRRSPAATAPTSEAQEAAITDETDACTPYSIPEVSALEGTFPTVWEIADILPGDVQAQGVWSAIQKSGIIPKSVKPKGTPDGDFDSFTPTYDQSNPDCWWTYEHCDVPKHPGIPDDIVGCPEPSTYGLTFDDGPNCTQQVLYDYLRDQKQKATMFYIGSNVMDWPLQAQRGLVDGHDICVHTWSHRYMTSLNDTQVFAELYYTAKAIKDVMGITVQCWRPPFGDVDDRVRAIATGLGLATIIWTDDTDDWQMKPAGKKSQKAIDRNYAAIIAGENSQKGNIVLAHELNNGTMHEFISQYPNIKARFDHVVPVFSCMNNTKPYLEDITYPSFEEYIAGGVASGLPGPDIKAVSTTYAPVLAQATSAASQQSAGAAGATKQNSTAAGKQSDQSAADGQKKSSASPAYSAFGAAMAVAGCGAVALMATL